MISVVPSYTSLADTLPLIIIPEPPCFEEKLQKQLNLFAKVLLKESSHDIHTLTKLAINNSKESQNIPLHFESGLSLTHDWQVQIL